MTADNPKPSPREIEIVHSGYQPSKVELEEDMRIDATFEDTIQALSSPVKIRYVKRPKR